MRASGKVNLIGLVLVLAIVTGLYLVWMLSPAYLDNFDIREAVGGSFHESGRVSDDQIRNRILDVARRVGTHQRQNELGEWVEATGLGLTPEQITVERDPVLKRILIRVSYARAMELKGLNRTHTIQFVEEREGPIP